MKKILLALLVLGAIGGFVGYKMWNKPHTDMAKAATDVTTDAIAIFQEFEANEDAANAKYLDKIIAISGTVKEAKTEGSTVVYLNAGSDEAEISAELEASERKDWAAGSPAKLKCTCTGKNMFTLELKRCVELK